MLIYCGGPIEHYIFDVHFSDDVGFLLIKGQWLDLYSGEILLSDLSFYIRSSAITHTKSLCFVSINIETSINIK